MSFLTRFLGVAAALALGAAAPAASAAPAVAAAGPPAAVTAVKADDMALGNPKAKVTVIEYASVVCPHCAAFNAETFPAFKAKYVDTGKVRYVFREFPTEPAQLAMAGFLVARCAPADKYFAVIDALFHGQEKLYESKDAKAYLMDAGKAGGLDEAGVEACFKTEDKVNALNERVKSALEADVAATPTFIIGRTKLEGGQSIAQLSAVIDPLLAAR